MEPGRSVRITTGFANSKNILQNKQGASTLILITPAWQN